MELGELGERLRAASGIDVDGEWHSFQQRAPTADVSAFLDDLLGRGLISGQLLRQLHAPRHVEVAPLVAVGEGGALVLGPSQKTIVAGADGTPIVAGSDGRPAPAATPGQATIAAPDATLASTSAPAERYQLLGCIGRGAMGEVHVARDGQLLRKVALKRILPDLAEREPLVARFFSEAQVTAQLDHPHVVPIYGVDARPGIPLGYSMKLVQGQTLGERLDEARASARSRDRRAERDRLAAHVEDFLKVCDAIAYAHGKGVIHRDLKPDNIMVGRWGAVYVMDWGICRLVGIDERGAGQTLLADVRASSVHGETRYGVIVGTPAYMSPEQAEGKVPELDGRSDLYALGLILFEIVTLRRAIGGGTVEETLALARTGKKLPLRHLTGTPIARELRAVIGKATRPDPGERYPTVAAFADDVRAAMRGEPVIADPDGPLRRLARWLGRHKTGALIALISTALVGALAVIGLLLRHEAAIERAGERERAVQSLLLDAARQASRIDAHFFQHDQRLALLAGGVDERLSTGDPDDRAVYTPADFADGTPPPTLIASPVYGTRISIDDAVFVLAPGVERDAVAEEMRRLAGVAEGLRTLLIASAEMPTQEPIDAAELIAERGTPVHRGFVTLPSGVHVGFPGSAGFPAGFDGRAQPIYAAAAGAPGVRWGVPTTDPRDGDVVLPAAIAVRDRDDALLAVAGFDLQLAWLQDHLLLLPDVRYRHSAYLVDEEDRVIAAGSRAAAMLPDVDRLPAPFPHPEVLEMLRVNDAEHTEITVDGRRVLAVAYPVEALGWAYVVLAAEADLRR